MSTRQVYVGTSRTRYGQARAPSYDDEYESQESTFYTYQGSNRRLGSASGPSGNSNNSGLRAARNRLQARYDIDCEEFKVKEEAKRRKKLEEKLKRYKGVGELGNKLSSLQLSQSDKCVGLQLARNDQQTLYKEDTRLQSHHSAQQSVTTSGIEEEKRKKKLEEKLNRYKGVGELGNKMNSQQLSQSDKHVSLQLARNEQQTLYKRDACLQSQRSDQQPATTRDISRNLRAEETISVERFSGENSSSGGQRLGGDPVPRVKGQHPLLALILSNQ